MPNYRTEGIIIKKKDFGEADKLLTLYSKENGKMKALAPGARKIASRKGASTDLFSHGIFYLAEGRNFEIITEIETLNLYAQIRDDLKKSAYAFYIAEIIDHFAPEGNSNYPLYRLFLETLSLLARAKRKHELWIRAFEVKSTTILGFGPELYQCAECRRAIVLDKFFEAAKGGLVCAQCLDSGILLEEHILELLRDLARQNWGELARLRYEEDHLLEAEKILSIFLSEVLETKLSSEDFLDKVEEIVAKEGF